MMSNLQTRKIENRRAAPDLVGINLFRAAVEAWSQTTPPAGRLLNPRGPGRGWAGDQLRTLHWISRSRGTCRPPQQASVRLSQIIELAASITQKRSSGAKQKRSPPSKAGRNVNGPPQATAPFSARGATTMKNLAKQGTSHAVSCAIDDPHLSRDLSKSLLGKFALATTLTFVLVLGNLTAVQAEDYSPVWKTMKPLYAVSFDVGRKHVLSYFLSKIDHCDLTLMVTDRPNEAPEGDEISKLQTARFTAAIDGGESARFDTGEGRALEYTCATSAQTMRVREVSQIAVAWPSEE
jgi:hypothetical protein